MLTLRIIRQSSREADDLLSARLRELAAVGITARYQDLPPDLSWTYTASNAAHRGAALLAALVEPDTDAVLCARGGYGASDLLPALPWDQLAALRSPKLLVGFSDASALHAAIYTRLGWPGLHAPMPATVLWGNRGDMRDVEALLAVLTSWREHGSASFHLPVSLITPATRPPTASEPLVGPLFGGCFSVLSNLIGTPYFPQTLADHIVFIEDTDESPARLMRMLNQWIQAERLRGVKALVLGHLRRLGEQIPDNAAYVLAEFAIRSGVPTFHTPLFGHTSPNMPLMIGADARIDAGVLAWTSRSVSRPKPNGGHTKADLKS